MKMQKYAKWPSSLVQGAVSGVNTNIFLAEGRPVQAVIRKLGAASKVIAGSGRISKMRPASSRLKRGSV